MELNFVIGAASPFRWMARIHEILWHRKIRQQKRIDQQWKTVANLLKPWKLNASRLFSSSFCWNERVSNLANKIGVSCTNELVEQVIVLLHYYLIAFITIHFRLFIFLICLTLCVLDAYFDSLFIWFAWHEMKENTRQMLRSRRRRSKKDTK